jgi:hypothetical protein
MNGPFRVEGRRFALDLLVGLGLYSLALIAIVGGTSPAGAVENAVLALTETSGPPLILIAAMFSLFMAFNLALYRHVRRVYGHVTPSRRRSDSRPAA